MKIPCFPKYIPCQFGHSGLERDRRFSPSRDSNHGPSGRVSGLYYAFGFCGHGFQLGLGVGDVMSELIDTGTTTTPIEPFKIGRSHSRSVALRRRRAAAIPLPCNRPWVDGGLLLAASPSFVVAASGTLLCPSIRNRTPNEVPRYEIRHRPPPGAGRPKPRRHTRRHFFPDYAAAYSTGRSGGRPVRLRHVVR
jgi:hypothetical protein